MKRLRIAEVMEKVGFKKTKVYDLIKKGEFPKARKDGVTAFWLEDEIDKWIEKRHAEPC